MILLQILNILTSISCLYCLYSNKIAYHDTFSQDQLDFLNDFNNYQIPKCKIEQFYFISRHGARYPSHKQVKQSFEFMNSIKKVSKYDSILNKINLEVFQNKPNYGLTELGSNEMRLIAKRFKERFKELFEKVNIEQFSFKSSSKSRSYESGLNFTQEIFAPNSELFTNVMEFDDELLRSHKRCQKYKRSIDDLNSPSYRELNSFKKSKLVLKMIDEFKKRHLVDENFKVDPEDLMILSIFCDIERAHRMELNYCQLFTYEDSILLEYLHDLKSYWLKSHGVKTNAIVSCNLIVDWLNETQKFIENRADKKSVLFRFGHAENIYPLVAALNLFKDKDHLQSHNYDSLINRLYKSSKVAPFSSNLALLLIKCDTSNEYKVLLLINELPIGVIQAGKLFCKLKNSVDHLILDKSTCELNDFKNELLENLNCLEKDLCEVSDNRSEL